MVTGTSVTDRIKAGGDERLREVGTVGRVTGAGRIGRAIGAG